MSAVLIRFSEAARQSLRPGRMVGTGIADIGIGRFSACACPAAPSHIAGVIIRNDTTARDLQRVELGKNRIVDWFASKCLDQPSPPDPEMASAKAMSRGSGSKVWELENAVA